MHSSVMHKLGAVIMQRAYEPTKAEFDRVIRADSNYVICPAALRFNDEEWERGHNMQVEALRLEACGL